MVAIVEKLRGLAKKNPVPASCNSRHPCSLCTVSSVNPSVQNLSTTVGCLSSRTPRLDTA